MSRKTPYRLKHYHQLKMSGSLSQESVINLIKFATALTLHNQSVAETSDFSLPVENVDLYDVNHVDAGTRFLGKSYGYIRVYKSRMTKISTAPLTGHIAVSSVTLDGIGSDRPQMRLNGRPEIDGLESIQHYAAADTIQEILKAQRYDSQILGRLTVGKSFSFGVPEFRAPPNENFDGLVNVLSFNDSRYTT